MVLLLIRVDDLTCLPSLPCCLYEQLLTTFSGRLKQSTFPLLPEDTGFLVPNSNVRLCDCSAFPWDSMCDLLAVTWPNINVKSRPHKRHDNHSVQQWYVLITI